MRSLTIIILTFVFTSLTFFGQANDNSKYFDDGKISEAKNVIKLNLSSIIHGDVPIFYERAIGNSFAIEVGAGLLMPYYVPDLIQLLSDEKDFSDPDSGYSLWFQPKFYFGGNAPELVYVGLQYRRRNYKKDSSTFVYTDISFNYGYQLILGKRIALDYSSGVGFRFRGGDLESGISGVIVPVHLKLGVLF